MYFRVDFNFIDLTFDKMRIEFDDLASFNEWLNVVNSMHKVRILKITEMK